ncbi:MAG TPA: DHA2 family efflux MFS transporter permease subunit [Burkholderiales bacterium]|nr:DHA2 family efflux MFS transporter permease subunit [Burkholderiales bacterium]
MPRHAHPGLVTASVMLASLLYSIDWTIAVVALPHMQGHFTATQDQIAWVITSYIVASAIMIPTGGWLSTRFGRKRVFLSAVGGFTFASILCGSADSLPFEVLSRILQGMCGAFLIPLSHSIILDTYPPEEHGKAMALWGTGSVFGSVIGPTIGGFVTEHLSWRYIFYINVPLGLIALVGVMAFLPETKRDASKRLDWFGFVTLAIGIGSLQMMLDRGQRLDWFESPEIVFEAALACLGLYLFNAHSFTARTPFLDPRLFIQRKFFLSLLFISFYGFLTVPTMVLMPTFLENLQGYPIDTIGLLQSPRGVGMLSALVVSGRITGKIDPRILIAFGLLTLGISSAEMSQWTAEVDKWPIVWTGLLQGAGAGIMLVPIQLIAFPSLPAGQRTEATSVFNLVRSVCSSAGVSVTLALFVHTSAMSRAGLSEHVSPYSDALRAAESSGTWSMASTEKLAMLARELDRQAAVTGYNDAFLFLAAASLAAIPLLLFVGRTDNAPTAASDKFAVE